MTQRRQDSMERVTITPEDANRFLERIDLERYRWRPKNFRNLVADMKAGRFDSMASIPLVVDYSGFPYNGRHRFAAQVATSKTYRYWMRTCSPEMAKRIQTLGDAPAAWSTRDELKSRGEAYQTELGAALVYLDRYAVTGGVRARYTPTTAESLKLLEENKGLRDWTGGDVTAAAKSLKISKGMCVAMAYVTSRLDVPDAQIQYFWETLKLLGSTNPAKVAEAAQRPGAESIMAYVQWLNNHAPKPGTALKRSETVVWALLHMTWNAFVLGKRMSSRSMRWNPEKQPFPPVVGNGDKILVLGSDEARELFAG